MYHDERKDWQVGSSTELPFDPLLGCLVFLTKHFDRPCSDQTLIAGLPLENNRLNPELFVRAAERAKLSARVLDYDLEQFDSKFLPAVLLMNNQSAWVVTSIDNQGNFQVIQPEAGDGVHQLTLAELQENYSGYAIFTKPKYRYDERPEDKKTEPSSGWFWRVIKESIGIYSEVLVASFFISIFALASPLFIMNVYDRVVPNEAIHTLWVLAAGVTLAFTFDFILKNLRGYFLTMAAKHVDIKLSRDIFQRLMGIEMGVRPSSVGSLVHTVHSFEAFREFITSATIATVIDIPFTLLFLAVVYMIGGNLVMVPLLLMPIILGVSFAIQFPLTRYVKESFKHSSEKQSMLIESLSTAETIKGIRAEGPMQRRWEGVIKNSAQVSTKIHVLSGLATNFSMFAQLMASICVVIMGVYKVSANEITMGAIIACTILTGRCLAPITQIAGLMSRYQQAKAGLDSVNNIMQMPVERPHDVNFLHRPNIQGAIAFDKVSFNYPNQKVSSLSNVSFDIKPGEKVGVIGRTGSGKTTIEKLILKLYRPSEGSILIDGTELNQIDPAELRHYIGYVPQDVVLFNGTVRQNIVAGAPYVTDDAVVTAANLAGVNLFTDTHPDGFDREVGERGSQLSGGQRQAIALARALLLDPPILVLDEPSNSMDDTTTMQFIQRFKTTLSSKTLILVTHKSSMLQLTDRLVIMDNGRVVADGPREKVLGKLTEGNIKVKNHG